ncbi:hypothetical protein Q3C22_13470, partial [Enterococcus faecium]|nr:hypothetical protein [Enterococcus faecium]
MEESERICLFLLAVFYCILIILTKNFYTNGNETTSIFVLGNWKDNNTGQLFKVTEDKNHVKIECNHRIVAEDLTVLFISENKCIFKDLKNNKYEFTKKSSNTID